MADETEARLRAALNAYADLVDEPGTLVLAEIGGNGQGVAMKWLSVRSSSRRCHSLV